MVFLKSFKVSVVTLLSTLLMAVAAMGSSLYGLYTIDALSDRISYQTTNSVPSLSGMAAADHAVAGARLLITKHFSARTPQELRQTSEKLESQFALVEQRLAAFAPLVSDPTEQRYYDEIRAEWSAYKAEARNVQQLLDSQGRDVALTRFNTHLVPIGARIDAAVSKDMEYNAALAARRGGEAQRFAENAFVILGVLAALVVGMMLLAMAIQRNRLGHPLGQIHGAMGEMAGGNLDRAVPCVELTDEIGEIARALGAITEGVTARTRAEAEARAAIQARVVEALGDALGKLKAGKLDCRIDQAFPAEYEALRIDFNETVQTLSTVIIDVSAAAGNVTTGSSEIASAATDLSRRTVSQAAAIEETSASVRELAASVSEAASVAEQANRNAREAETAAAASAEVMTDAVSAMDEIARSSTEMEAIVSLIDGIAFQTNLLALNAGVEAARAGEAGKGFAVVASEVRSLAQRAGEAAREISTIIKGSGSSVTRGVGLITRTQEALQQIHSRTSAVAEMIGTIADSAGQQAAALAQIDSAAAEMDGMTQKNAALVEESTAASRTLADEAQRLDGLMGRFDTGRPRAGLRLAPVVRAQPLPQTHGNAALAQDWSSF